MHRIARVSICWLACAQCALAFSAKSCQLQFQWDGTDAFEVKLAKEIQLHSAPLRFFANGAWHSSGPNGTLTQRSSRLYFESDELGEFTCINITWSAQNLVVHTSAKVYKNSCAIIFVQEVPDGATNTNASNPKMPKDGNELEEGAYPPILSFPSFSMSNLLRELGFLTWKGVFAKAVFGKDVAGTLAGLSSNGPVVLFDRELALVVSPLDNFKTAVHTYSAGAWETGVTSELTSLPVGFVHRTLITAEVGITQAIGSYGQIVQKLYAEDNGAYYYGDQWHEAGGGGQTCNEASMIEVARGLERENLLDAVRIWQLDDWWYPGHKAVFVHCVQNWTLVPPAFNRSLAELSRTVGKPLLLYVPFFCPENVYTQQFKFLQGSHGITQFAVPEPNNALAFYRMLFDYGMKNGMTGFEHDFLNFNFLAVPNFRKAFDASRRWLQAMHQAALERVVPIQFCMALPSDLMASLELQAVTNYRASDDYATTDNYDIGASSLLGFALQLRPSKDSLWTRRPADAAASGRPWGPHQNPGANCELNVIIATLSTGPAAMEQQKERSRAALREQQAQEQGLRPLQLVAEQTAWLSEQNIPITDDLQKYTWDIRPPAQVGDLGLLTHEDGSELMKVKVVQVFAGYVLHVGPMPSLKVGDQVYCEVDYEHRNKVAPNHTMTHVLNWALREVLGEGIDQRGSLVTADRLRFDFTYEASSGVSVADLEKVESLVQKTVDRGLPAIAGLRAMAGESYPDPVRVVTVGRPIDNVLEDPGSEKWMSQSVEFCGGTHISQTSEAKHFVLLEEKGIAKSVRRIIAATGEEDALMTLQRNLDTLVLPAVPRAQLRDRLGQLRKQLKKKQKKNKKGKASKEEQAAAFAELKQAVAEAKSLGMNYCVKIFHGPGVDGKTLREAASSDSAMMDIAVMVLNQSSADSLECLAAVPEVQHSDRPAGKWVQAALAAVGGKGGGQPAFAQGAAKGTKAEALQAAEKAAKSFASKNVKHWRVVEIRASAGKVILAGGRAALGYTNDVWLWQHSGDFCSAQWQGVWSQLTPQASWLPRHGHRLVGFAGETGEVETVLLVGGFGGEPFNSEVIRGEEQD
eukprot:g30546.t1